MAIVSDKSKTFFWGFLLLFSVVTHSTNLPTAFVAASPSDQASNVPHAAALQKKNLRSRRDDSSLSRLIFHQNLPKQPNPHDDVRRLQEMGGLDGPEENNGAFQASDTETPVETASDTTEGQETESGSSEDQSIVDKLNEAKDVAIETVNETVSTHPKNWTGRNWGIAAAALVVVLLFLSCLYKKLCCCRRD